MDLSIIIVTYNSRDHIRENLLSIRASKGDFKKEVIVVDNNSHDDTASIVKSSFPDIRLVANPDNAGFAKANNTGLKLSQGRYILLLNPDMKLFPDTLENMIGWMDRNHQAAIAGCCLTGPDGSLVRHIRRFPAFSDQLAITLNLPHIYPPLLNRYLRKEFDYSRPSEVDSIRGSFFWMRRETYSSVGPLDERFFVWFEEVDYCRQCRAKGLKVYYTPAAKAVDFVGQSFKKTESFTKQRYFRNSMIEYFKKWHPAWQVVILKTAWMPGGIIKKIAGRLRLKPVIKT